MASPFQGYDIYPGLDVKGAVAPAVRELLLKWNTALLGALQMVPEEQWRWADALTGLTEGMFDGRIPLDVTALDGFEEFTGERDYKTIDVIALRLEAREFYRAYKYPILFQMFGPPQIKEIYNALTTPQQMMDQARTMRARLAATVLMKGTESVNQVKVYTGNDIPGANLPLFSKTTQHYANPADKNSRRFKNYFTGQGKFDIAALRKTRQNMRAIPAATLSAETLGLQVTHILGPTHMEEPFNTVKLQLNTIQTATVNGNGVAAGVTNIYAQGNFPIEYMIAPSLDADPYLQAWKDAHPSAEPGDYPHLWFAISQSNKAMRPIEMMSPGAGFAPRVMFLGEETDKAKETKHIHVIADLEGGASAGFPHCIARYEEL